MTWHEAWDVFVLVVQVSLLVFVWALTMTPTLYAVWWLYVTFLEGR